MNERDAVLEMLAKMMGDAGYCNYEACKEYLARAYDAGQAALSPAGTGQPREQPGYWDAEDYRRAADVHETAERIIKRVVPVVLSIAYTRTGLHDVADCDPIDEKEFVDDGLAVALGEDTGCLDPDDLSAENCEVLYVEQELTEILKRAVRDSVKGEGETATMKINDEQIEYMVQRFLGWRLPENFNPDAGISFKRTFNEHTDHPMKSEPTGTNLFDYGQAKEMIRYLIDGMPAAPAPSPEELAREFHETYERLAPEFGHETRKESAKPWSEVPEKNKRLMIAVCAALLRSRMERAERPHKPMTHWKGREIKGLKRCENCGLSETYWLKFPACPLPSAPDTEKKA